MKFFLLLVSCLLPISAYKMGIFVPCISNSQVQFSVRVAETLANAGHDVTLIMMQHFKQFTMNVKIPKNVKVYDADAHVEGFTQKQLEEEQARVIFKVSSIFDREQFAQMQRGMGLIAEACRSAVRNKPFLNWLASQKFDIAYAYMYSSCPIGLIHHAKIPTWVWLNSGGLMDFVAQTVGVPIIPSYVPPIMMESTDELSFIERVKSVIGHGLTYMLLNRMVASKETEIFREELNQTDFPHTFADLAVQCPLVMVNTNELYDLPRPTLAKVVNIGGLGVSSDDAKPLPQEFESIVSAGKGTIVFSFGSVAPSHLMPWEWKMAFLDAFRQFPDYQFVMKYSEQDLNEHLPKNVHLFKWLPQKDLLLHKKTKAFISHGGYNSLQETISAGVPIITVALFGDQPRNSKIALKQGIAVNIAKSEVNRDAIRAAIQQIITNDEFSRNAQRLRAMVARKPIKPDELLVRWSEFAAEFKTLDNLRPAGQKLNFLQYHSIDVVAFLGFIVLVILLIAFTIIRCIVRRCCCARRDSNEKIKVN